MFDAIPAYTETIRDVTTFTKRRGRLPVQKEGDSIDVRGFLHRDGSVLASVSLDALQKTPAEELYRQLGAKLAVGMPFKDVATVDSIYLPQVPPSSDSASRRVLKRLQEVSVGVVAPLDQLRENPLANAVALVQLEDSVTGGLPPLPPQAIRYAVKLTGIEPAHMYGTLKSLSLLAGEDAIVMAVLEAPAHVSRVHAARRAFQLLHDNGLDDLPVIISLAFPQAKMVDKDQLILRAGSSGGALLVDGLGDGVMLSVTPDGSQVHDPSFPPSQPPHLSSPLLIGLAGLAVRSGHAAGDFLQSAAGIAHALRQDGLRVLSELRPDTLRPARGD